MIFRFAIICCNKKYSYTHTHNHRNLLMHCCFNWTRHFQDKAFHKTAKRILNIKKYSIFCSTKFSIIISFYYIILQICLLFYQVYFPSKQQKFFNSISKQQAHQLSLETNPIFIYLVIGNYGNRPLTNNLKPTRHKSKITIIFTCLQQLVDNQKHLVAIKFPKLRIKARRKVWIIKLRLLFSKGNFQISVEKHQL